MGKKTINDFICEAKSVHGEKYSYDHFNYISYHTPSYITCPKHGDFLQSPANHISGKKGCRKCGAENSAKIRAKNTNDFIKEAKSIWGNTYDYSKVEYINTKTKVCIICPEHGEFWQLPNKHTKQKHGCPKCNGGVGFNTEEFIKRSRIKHGSKYDYSKSNYVNAKTKLIVTCPIHGDFITNPHWHIEGEGCPKCSSSSLERNTRVLLENMQIKYTEQYSPSWLGKQRVDFYLSEFNIAIECQGIQHFEPVEIFGGNEKLVLQKELDARKAKLCEENGVHLEYINYNEDVEKRVEEILNKHNNDLGKRRISKDIDSRIGAESKGLV